MKKIGLTISDENYKRIVEIAKENNLTPTTICSLIIEGRLNYYEYKNMIPIFKTRTYELTKQNLPKIEKTNTMSSNETEEELPGISWDEFFEEMENDDNNTRASNNNTRNSNSIDNIDNSGD